MYARMMRDSYDPYDYFSYLDADMPRLPRTVVIPPPNPFTDFAPRYVREHPLIQALERRQAAREAERKCDENFEVMMNVRHFKPDEIDVKTVDDFVVVHGKHEEQADEHGFVTREFTRRYKLPDDVEPDTVTSSLSQDGILRIQAPRKQLEPPPKNERVIPIKIQRTAAMEMVEEAMKNEQASAAQASSEGPKEE